MRIVVGFKVTPDYEALRPADWARAADARGERGERRRTERADGARRAAVPAAPRPGTSAASSASSTRPRWSSRCGCATRARSAA